jgi:hypothetical protein
MFAVSKVGCVSYLEHFPVLVIDVIHVAKIFDVIRVTPTKFGQFRQALPALNEVAHSAYFHVLSVLG